MCKKSAISWDGSKRVSSNLWESLIYRVARIYNYIIWFVVSSYTLLSLNKKYLLRFIYTYKSIYM